MEIQATAEVIAMKAAQDALRRHFLGWQCRLRQLSVREDAGRPNAGMRPQVRRATEGQEPSEIIVLILPSVPQESTAEFRHLARRTQDPRERYQAALKLLSANFYQYPEAFSDEMTALLGLDSALADALLAAGSCHLAFDHFNQRYRLPCRLRDVAKETPAYQATYWHNALFNPTLPGDVRVLGFQPDWAAVVADPATA
jgi:hypothetical protein